MNTLLPRVAFWLVPEHKDHVRLYALIQRLAKRHNTVVFDPHVTIFSCGRSSQQHELVAAERLARSFQEVTLEVDSLKAEGKLTQALVVNFKNDEDVRGLYNQLKTTISNPSEYILKPHLSLLYQNLQAEESRALVKEINLEMDAIHFNELWAVAIPEQLKTLDDLKCWQTLLRCRLAPRENVDTIE